MLCAASPRSLSRAAARTRISMRACPGVLASVTLSRQFIDPVPASGARRMSAAIVEGLTMAFDRDMKRKQLARSAARVRDGACDRERADVLRDRVCEDVVDRLQHIKRPFQHALDLGAHSGNFLRAYTASVIAARGGDVDESSPPVEALTRVHMIESCEELLYRDAAEWKSNPVVKEVIPHVHDEESELPFPDDSLDLVVSVLSLHWMNALPRVFSEVKRVLRPDGLFIGAVLGGDTLAEVRSSFVLAETEREGGVSPHVSPMIGLADMGSLLTSTGFTLPSLDAESHVIEYPDAGSVFEHLREMGESNAALSMRRGAKSDTFLAAAAAYHALYADNQERVVPATYQIIHFVGWKPDASQQKPLRRGSVPKGFAKKAQASSPITTSS